MSWTFLIPLMLMFAGLIYSTYRIAGILPASPAVRWVAIGLWLSMFVLLLVSFIFRHTFPVWVARIVYTMSTAWIIIMMYVVMTFLVLDLSGLVLPVLRPYLHNSWVGVGAIACFIFSIFIYGNIRYHHKVRMPLEIQLDKPLDRPIRLVAVSDLHLGYTIGRDELARWVDIINSERPDMVLIAGDLLDGAIEPIVESRMWEELNRIEAPTYAVLGNHEYIGGKEASQAFFSRTKIRLLRDQADLFAGQIYIVGRDDAMNRHRATTKSLIDSLDSARPIILLDHQPHRLEESEQAGVDFQFSGHTHRGQIFPGNLITDYIYECSHGYHRRGQTQYYVSSGLGIWGGKFRIGSQSEYTVITLKGR